MKRILFSLLASFVVPVFVLAQTNEMEFQSTIKVESTDTHEQIIEKAAHVVPTANQLAALKNEFIAFVHFGPNTFTRMEWGNGMEDPKIFDLKDLDTDQWCEAMKAAGMKMVILTAKHHDGFVLWQSRYTTHGVMSTNFKDGKGDIMRELSVSCKKYGLKLGIYLSPADLFQIESPDGLYGNLSEYTKRTIPREVPGRPFENKTKFEFEVDDYNEYFLNQLFELLTEYGPIYEVWFDGAHPKTKGGQKYNYQAWRKLIRTLAPEATIFGREDLRWCGNEGGYTRDTEWNVITYDEDPRTMNSFMDLYGDLGTRSVYFGKEKPYYLHYQPAETNSSIRAGWFYRDDTNQNVRSADDVFDIYERSVGGNSIFLLNIPPNREGRFSQTDVDVLKETGKRINETYGVNLLEKSDAPKLLLDNDLNTYVELNQQPNEIIISMPIPIAINRIAIQEAVGIQGERVEKHAVDAYINGEWKEVATANNIGYKRILRFPEVTTQKIRIRVLESRLSPAIASVSAHYYRERPPMLNAKRSKEGFVSIGPKLNEFNWANWGSFDSESNLKEKFENDNCKIYYTTNGQEPNKTSKEYTEPFLLSDGELKAVAFFDDEKGTVYQKQFGFIKNDWKLLNISGEDEQHLAYTAFDEDPLTYWLSKDGDTQRSISIDLGTKKKLDGFSYTPQRQNSDGMIEEGVFQISNDGEKWDDVETFKFGNLINDPTVRYHYFKKSVKARYIRIVAQKIASGGKTAAAAEFDVF